MQMHPVKSSNVTHVGYDAATQTLAVRFKGGGTYHYDGVPAKTHAALLAAKSIGGHLATHIKPKHKAEKLK